MIYQKYKILQIFVIFILFVDFSMFVSDKYLFSEDIFVESLSEQFSDTKIQELLAQNREWGWLRYVFSPIPYLIKFYLVAMTLYIGLFFTNIKIPFKELFRIVNLSEFVFLLPSAIKLIWFIFLQPIFTLDDIQSFHPLSAVSLFDYKLIESFLLYPLKLINVFELIYWFVLAYGLSKVINQNLAESMKLVLASYGTGLLLWVVFVTFISLNAT